MEKKYDIWIETKWEGWYIEYDLDLIELDKLLSELNDENFCVYPSKERISRDLYTG